MPSHDLRQTSDTLFNAGNAINDRIRDEFFTLPFPQLHEMSNKAQELFMQSKLLLAQSVIELKEETQDNLKALEEANAKISAAIKTVAKVQQAINVAAKLVIVASNILTGNLKDIPKSAQDVLKEIKK